MADTIEELSEMHSISGQYDLLGKFYLVCRPLTSASSWWRRRRPSPARRTLYTLQTFNAPGSGRLTAMARLASIALALVALNGLATPAITAAPEAPRQAPLTIGIGGSATFAARPSRARRAAFALGHAIARTDHPRRHRDLIGCLGRQAVWSRTGKDAGRKTATSAATRAPCPPCRILAPRMIGSAARKWSPRRRVPALASTPGRTMVTHQEDAPMRMLPALALSASLALVAGNPTARTHWGSTAWRWGSAPPRSASSPSPASSYNSDNRYYQQRRYRGYPRYADRDRGNYRRSASRDVWEALVKDGDKTGPVDGPRRRDRRGRPRQTCRAWRRWCAGMRPAAPSWSQPPTHTRRQRPTSKAPGLRVEALEGRRPPTGQSRQPTAPGISFTGPAALQRREVRHGPARSGSAAQAVSSAVATPAPARRRPADRRSAGRTACRPRRARAAG